jgi:hypothetical protein
MMKKKLLILISLLWVACNNVKPLSDLQIGKLNGKIKSITTSVFFYDSTKAAPHLGKLVNKNIREFNTDGNEISCTFINEEDELESIRINSFNDEKIKTESKENDEEGNLLYTTKYTYDKNFNLVEAGTTEHNTNTITKQVNYYDKLANLTATTGYKGNNEVDFNADYKYNDKKQLIEEKIFLADGTLDYRADNRFDEKGRMISSTGFAKDSSVLFQIRYDYKVFDKEENWLLRNIYRDSVLIKVEQVQIEYHP